MEDLDHTKKQKVATAFGRIAQPDFGVDGLFFGTMGRRLVDFAKLRSGSRVLDVAAGAGASLFPAAEIVGKEGSVVGIDLANELVVRTSAEIRRSGIRNAEMRLMDAEALGFSEGSFDYLLCGFALFFFPDLNRALSEFCRVLKIGGTCASAVFGKGPVQWNWYEQLLEDHGILRPDPVPELFTPLPESPSGLEQAFKNAGFGSVLTSIYDYDSVYRDESDWWERVMSSGDGVLLKTLDAGVLDRFKTSAFHNIQEFKKKDGIHRPYQVLFLSAKKS